MPKFQTVRRCVLVLAPLAVGAAACGGPSSDLTAAPYDAADQISANTPDGRTKVNPDKPLEVSVKGDEARITDVTATDTAGRYIRGELTPDGKRWRSTVPLAAGTRYTVRVSTEDEDGAPGRKTLQVDTSGEGKRLTVKFGPDAGTYGVGQPITAELSRPVKGQETRALIERALKVDSTPRVRGSWTWADDKTLHYRPKEFWPTHATIAVHSNLDGLKISKNLYGGPAKPLKLRTGDRIEAITDASAHQMTVKRNGKVIRTIPVTTGKPGYETRNGVKVVLAKESYVRMTSASIGASDFYDLGVYWATRVTWSGEYLHAAPWSVGSQGVANSSHGCTGMSTSNAKWFFDTVRVGDIVKVVNSQGETMTAFDNGFGDWNMDWQEWLKGSTLGGTRVTAVNTEEDASGPADAARLRPRV